MNASLECASMFLERKLYSESKDEIAIVLLGTDETSNPLDYENIKLVNRGLSQADWEAIKFLRQHVQGTQVEADWVDALIVALDLLKRKSDEKKYGALKIVLFSDLGCEANSDQKELMIEGMRLLDNIDITHIGPKQLVEHLDKQQNSQNSFGESNGDSHESPKPGPSREEPRANDEKPLTETQRENLKVMNEIIVETDGSMFSVDDAVEAFLYKNKKGKKPWPWKVLMEIGPDIKINITGYVRIRRENPKPWKRYLADGSSNEFELHPENVLIRNNELQEAIEPEDTVVGYSYGTDVVTISAQDEEACKFEGGPKSMMVYGFVGREEIQSSNLIGDGSYVFLPNEDDENSLHALSSLSHAMIEMGMVAIVRRVYSKASAPRLGVLLPEEDDEGGVYLAYVELPFMEERRELQFPSLDDPKRPLSEEQLDAIDDLIVNMDLEAQSVEEGETVFMVEPENELNPQYQYLYQALTSRSLYPGRPLPDVPARFLEGLSMPAELRDRAAPFLDKLKSLFPTEEIKHKSKRTGDKVFGDKEDEEIVPEKKKSKTDDDDPDSSKEVYNVGSINPAEDFNYLLSHSVSTGANLQSAALQMEEVVERFMASAFGTDLNAKIISCLKAYREACCDRNEASLYNNFLKTVKNKSGKKLWTDVCDSNLGLIQAREASSGVEQAEAELFLKPVSAEENDDMFDDDDEDMLDLL